MAASTRAGGREKVGGGVAEMCEGVQSEREGVCEEEREMECEGRCVAQCERERKEAQRRREREREGIGVYHSPACCSEYWRA